MRISGDTPPGVQRLGVAGKKFSAAGSTENDHGGAEMAERDESDSERVRIARIHEIDRVAALWALITEHHSALDPLFRMRRGPVAEGELRELLRALHRDPDAVILVYVRDGTPEGLCIVRIDRAPPILEETERAEITDLGVRPELRRRGVGRLLVEEAQAWVRDRGVARVEIQVATGNLEGQAFWRAIGYADLMDVLHKRL
jgi:ribosomal protein S18 acetylase RimI-like enzyme